MSGAVWRQNGVGVIVGGDAGRLLGSANLLAAFASEGIDRYNRRVQRATELIARREAGEYVDEVDTEFLDSFLADLEKYDRSARASAEAGLTRRANKRLKAKQKELNSSIDKEFAVWKRQRAEEASRLKADTIVKVAKPETKFSLGLFLLHLPIGFGAAYAAIYAFGLIHS